MSGTRSDRLGPHGSTLCYCSHNYGTVSCYNLPNGSKSFDPQTSSTRAVPGPKSMASSHHTQKTDSEPSRTKILMQKSDSSDATLVITFTMTLTMTNNTHTRVPWHVLKNRQSRDKKYLWVLKSPGTTRSTKGILFQG